MVVVLSISGVIWLLMMAALVRYFLLPTDQQGAFRSDPTRFHGLTRGENALRGMVFAAMAAGVILYVWRPRGENLIGDLDEAGLIVLAACGAVAWLGVTALVMRRVIYKRWL